MDALPASQASSHYPLEPISASILAERETARRNALRQLGPCRSGCAELDECVLVGGGFERGCVVGMSSEDEDGFGMPVSLSCRLLPRYTPLWHMNRVLSSIFTQMLNYKN